MAPILLVVELLRKREENSFLPSMHSLTLGQALPCLSLYSAAKAFRSNAGILVRRPRKPWHDDSFSHNFICFAGVNSDQACGLPLCVDGAGPQRQQLRSRSLTYLKQIWEELSVLFGLYFDELRDPATRLCVYGLITAEVDC